MNNRGRYLIALFCLLTYFMLTGQTSCDVETVRIVAHSDSSVHSDTLVRVDGVATSSYPATVAHDFGYVAYNTSPNQHVYLMSGNIVNGTTPTLYARLPAADGPDGDGRYAGLIDVDPEKELASVRVYNSGICSSNSGNPYSLALLFPLVLISELNAQEGIFGASMVAQNIRPVFKSDSEPISSPEDFMRVQMVWDADLIEGGLIGNVFECNGARVRMNFDLFFEVQDGDVEVILDNFYVNVTQQPGWSGGIGANRCRSGVRSRIEDHLTDLAPSLIESGIQSFMFANATRLKVSDLGMAPKACNSNGTCSWTIGGKTFRGGCNANTNQCTHLFAKAKHFNLRPENFEVVWLSDQDDDEAVLNYESLSECTATRHHVSKTTGYPFRFTSFPYVQGDQSLLH